jgi:hypothetical protein
MIKTRHFIFLMFATFILGSTSCKNKSYPCPAYGEAGDKNASMKVGPDGTPISSVNRQFDENGLVKKKKVKRIHK